VIVDDHLYEEIFETIELAGGHAIAHVSGQQ
jgi:hypothetical protein